MEILTVCWAMFLQYIHLEVTAMSLIGTSSRADRSVAGPKPLASTLPRLEV